MKTKTAKSVLFIMGVMASVGMVGCANPKDNASSIATASEQKLNSTGIIGGTDAVGSEDFAKVTVLLVDAVQGAVCSGTLLATDTLLTAAHCVQSQPAALKVVFLADLDALTAENKAQVVRDVTALEASPTYALHQDEEFNNGDIAIVHFVGGLASGYTTALMAALPKPVKTGDKVLLAGYGNSVGGSEQSGAGKLRSVETSIKNASYSKSEILVEQSLGKGACHGDSGGPLFIRNRAGALVVAGVTSRGVDDPSDTCGVSAAYTNVGFYVSWIKETVVKLRQPKPALLPIRVAAAH